MGRRGGHRVRGAEDDPSGDQWLPLRADPLPRGRAGSWAGDLVVEIVSDDSARRDRKDKFGEYADAGVREYWVVDPRPLRQALYVYVLTDEGYYEQVSPDADGLMHSAVIPGLWINPAWLWQERSPNLVEILKLLEIIP